MCASLIFYTFLRPCNCNRGNNLKCLDPVIITRKFCYLFFSNLMLNQTSEEMPSIMSKAWKIEVSRYKNLLCMNHLIFWEGSYTWPISSFAINRSFLCKNHFVRLLWFAILGELTFGFGMDLEGKELDPFLADIEQWKPPKRIQPSHRSRQYRWPGKYESSVTRYRKKYLF